MPPLLCSVPSACKQNTTSERLHLSVELSGQLRKVPSMPKLFRHGAVAFYFCLNVDVHVSWSSSRHSVRLSAGMVVILMWPSEEFSKAAFIAVLLSGNSRIATTSYAPRQ